MTHFSVVIPVKDGERYLEEVLDALRREAPDEVLVIDSGSQDRSREIVRTFGYEVLSIDPHEFGHGRTRNLGAERTTGDLICFLTQDATPCPGWLQAYAYAFSLDERIGAAYGPHLPRPETSPMIARELTEFFATFAAHGDPTLQRSGDPTFLSNVNACYARRCWEEIRFRDVDYAEDQAFGADMLAASWLKVYHPDAAVLHAHDYRWSGFMRRYFDEYRGLRGTIGHIERVGLRSSLRHVSANVVRDRRWISDQGVGDVEALRWTARSVAHHSGRKVFAALGSRADRLPAPARRALSLERRDTRSATELVPPPPRSFMQIPPARNSGLYEDVMLVHRDGPAPLLDVPPGLPQRDRLRLALVLPPFTKGSGGHYLLLQILRRLELRGHVCSVWMHDAYGGWGRLRGGQLRHDIREYFAPIDGAVYNGFDEWHGADVVLATGWETVHPTLRLPDCHARVYLVNDYEPDFFAASAERSLAADTYQHGLYCLAGSPWLQDLLRERHGAAAEAFQYGVDHDIYHCRDLPRRADTVIYYARISTQRRAVPIGLLALTELHRRRPDVRIILFGSGEYIETAFPYELAGILSADQLAELYSQATVGLCLSLTNFSLMPKEMLACGLPCVELAGVSAESIFGQNGPLELAPLDPIRIADAMEKLLNDRELWQQRSNAGIEFVSTHTWERATEQVEAGLRHALAIRQQRPS